MKNALKLVLVMLLALSAGMATAQHRGNRGGHHHGGGYWLAPLVIGAGVTYLVTRPQVYVEPAPVYYEPLPRVVSAPQPSNCHKETRKIFDEKSTPLGEQVFLVCPIATAPPVVTR